MREKDLLELAIDLYQGIGERGDGLWIGDIHRLEQKERTQGKNDHGCSISNCPDRLLYGICMSLTHVVRRDEPRSGRV